MLHLTRYTCSLVIFVAAASAYPQGGAAGYGQQSAGGYGQGGGRGGGNFGSYGASGTASAPALNRYGAGRDMAKSEAGQRPVRPEDDSAQGLWERRQMVLTPGDRVEFKFKMKAGETIFASASSDAFDPALEIDDAKNKKLAENDDRAEGDQQPFLIYRTTEEGTYTLKVLSYRSVSGGAFDVAFRTFKATDAGFTPALHTDLTPVHLDSGDRYVFRITAQKGKYYDLGFLTDGKNQWRLGARLVQVVGPTGVEQNDYAIVPIADGTMVFQASKDGDYYAEFYINTAKQVGTEFKQLTATPMAATSEQTLDLEPRELRILEFPVKPNLIVRTILSGAGPFVNSLSAPASKSDRFATGSDPGYETTREWTWFRMNVDSDNDVLRIFHGEGTARLAVRSQKQDRQKITVKNQEALPTWEPGRLEKGAIEIGDARFYLLKSTKSELMKVSAEASHFQLKLEIFRLDDGTLANSLMRRRSHTVGDDLYFPDADTFLIRISCDGNGGSGDFEIRQDIMGSTPYPLGGTQTLKLDGTNFGLYSMDLVKDKRYELITDRAIGTDVLDEDGQFLRTQVIGLGNVIVQYFVPTRSGRHRLWLRGGPATYRFRLELNIPPSLGK